MTVAEILVLHERYTAELVGLLIDRGQSGQAAVNARARAIEQATSSGVNITTAREMATSAAAQFDATIADLTGRIDALRARLHHLELVLAHRPED